MQVARSLSAGLVSIIVVLTLAASASASAVTGTYGMIHKSSTDPSVHALYRPPVNDVGAGVVLNGVLRCNGQPVLGCIAGAK